MSVSSLWLSFTISHCLFCCFFFFLRKKLKRKPVSVWQTSTRENSSVTSSLLTAWKPQQYCGHGEKIHAPRASSARGRVSSECQQRALDTDAPEGFIHNCQVLRQQSCPSKHVLPKCLVTGQTNRATSHRGRLFRAKKKWAGTSLVVQWLRLGAPSAGGQGLTLGQELAPTCHN